MLCSEEATGTERYRVRCTLARLSPGQRHLGAQLAALHLVHHQRSEERGTGNRCAPLHGRRQLLPSLLDRLRHWVDEVHLHVHCTGTVFGHQALHIAAGATIRRILQHPYGGNRVRKASRSPGIWNFPCFFHFLVCIAHDFCMPWVLVVTLSRQTAHQGAGCMLAPPGSGFPACGIFDLPAAAAAAAAAAFWDAFPPAMPP